MGKPIDCIEHRVTDGERWDTLAWRYYGDANQYGRIIAANPAIDIITHLPPNTVVLVPVLTLAEAQQQVDQESLPPWKR